MWCWIKLFFFLKIKRYKVVGELIGGYIRSKLTSRKTVVFLLSASIIVIMITGCFFVDLLVMRNTLQDHDWWENASSYEKRQLAQRALTRPLSFHHDACLLLIDHGNEESVPYLLTYLKWHDFFNRDDDFIVCTKSHCLEALQEITGKDLGDHYSDWESMQE